MTFHLVRVGLLLCHLIQILSDLLDSGGAFRCHPNSRIKQQQQQQQQTAGRYSGRESNWNIKLKVIAGMKSAGIALLASAVLQPSSLITTGRRVIARCALLH